MLPRAAERGGLTIRSTGHFAAVQFLSSFHSRQKFAHRKVPVSYDVRPFVPASAAVANPRLRQGATAANRGMRYL